MNTSTLNINGDILLLNTIDNLKLEQKGWITPFSMSVTINGDFYLKKKTRFLLSSDGNDEYFIPIYRSSDNELKLDFSEIRYAFRPLSDKKHKKILAEQEKWIHCNASIEILEDTKAWGKRCNLEILIKQISSDFIELNKTNFEDTAILLIKKVHESTKEKIESIKDLYDWSCLDFKALIDENPENTQSVKNQIFPQLPQFQETLDRISKICKKKLELFESEKSYETMSVSELEHELENALTNDNFEKAAYIRDAIDQKK